MQVDPFFNLETRDVLALVASGIAPKWKAIMHFELEPLIKEALSENEQFLTLTLAEQKAVLIEMAKKLVPEDDGSSRMTPQSVMNARTAIPVKNEEEVGEEGEES